MNTVGFSAYLEERKASAEEIATALSIVAEFEQYLLDEVSPPTTLENAISAHASAFSARLIAQKRNSFDHYLSLARYARFIRNNALFTAFVEMFDGAEVLENLYAKTVRLLGERETEALFSGIQRPPMGASNVDKPAVTQAMIERLEARLGAQACAALLGEGLRDLQDEWFLEGRAKYQACGGLDDYLALKGDEFIAELQRIRDAGELYFTQPVTDEVIDFVQRTPEIRQGVRCGDALYEIKIPFMTHEYLNASDEQMKRYHYCHCPWVRESLKHGDAQIPPVFCNCSAAFVKKPWEVIFDQPLQAEVVESVLLGDPWCKIAIYLPAGV